MKRDKKMTPAPYSKTLLQLLNPSCAEFSYRAGKFSPRILLNFELSSH